MAILKGAAWPLLSVLCCAAIQQSAATGKFWQSNPPNPEPPIKLKELLQSKITAEWEAFKKKDKKAYSDLLAHDFAAVEDDNEGMRNKSAAVAEIDRSVVNDYHLFGLKVTPLDANSALVTYELTLQFPPKATVRFKRVLVGEIWLKHNGQWKERYYQETHVR